MMVIKLLSTKETSGVPLAIFRIAFGTLMFVSQIRFLVKGWVKEMYVDPAYHFTFSGFDWVQSLSPFWMYSLVVLVAISALFIAFGLLYRISIVTFFLGFTYLELIDKSWYLNHYYLVSLIAFLLCFTQAGKVYAFDNLRRKTNQKQVPKWNVDILKWQIALVYFFAGIAKLKYGWLIEAQPMKIWLSARTDVPMIGSLFDSPNTAYVFSWFGMIYDLTIPFLLFNPKIRKRAYGAVIGFHLMTAILFQIGMFPWVMISLTLIFFSIQDWNRLRQRVFKIIDKDIKPFAYPKIEKTETCIPFYLKVIICTFFVLQLLLPLRHYLYKGDVLWNEKGFRFAWHVMLMEKNGMCEYVLKDKKSSKKWIVYPSQYLCKGQEKQMSFQPDMIHQFGKFLKNKYESKENLKLEVYVTAWVSLNGKPSRKMYDNKRIE